MRHVDELVYYQVDADNDEDFKDDGLGRYAITDRNFSVIGVETGGVGSGEFERVRYSAYGQTFGMPFGDVDADGNADTDDRTAITAVIGEDIGDASYAVEADINLDGSITTTDRNAASTATLGDGVLSGADNIVGYAGYLYEEATGMYLARHRWHMPELGRWANRDPIGYAGGDSNLYGYVGGRPLSFADPFGLEGTIVGGWLEDMGSRFRAAAQGTVFQDSIVESFVIFTAAAGAVATEMVVETVEETIDDPTGAKRAVAEAEGVIARAENLDEPLWEALLQHITGMGDLADAISGYDSESGELFDDLLERWGEGFRGFGKGLGLAAGGTRAITGRCGRIVCFVSGTEVLTPDGWVAIETIQPGSRVLTPETLGDEFTETPIDPDQTRLITMTVESIWDDGTIDTIVIRSLIPLWQVERFDLRSGVVSPLPLDMHEMGLPPMWGTVSSIEPCPPIGPGRGRVVTSTVTHLNSDVHTLTVRTEQGELVDIQPTGAHRFYSITEQAWVPASDLAEGDVLRTAGEPVAVVGVEAIAGHQAVYNLSVDQESVYFVSVAGVLAHNNGCKRNRPPRQKADPDAVGSHSTFLREGGTGFIKKWATWWEKLNRHPKDPHKFAPGDRFDKYGPAHDGVPTPHINPPDGPARAPFPHEVPKSE